MVKASECECVFVCLPEGHFKVEAIVTRYRTLEGVETCQDIYLKEEE